jgi:hypothetical protein
VNNKYYFESCLVIQHRVLDRGCSSQDSQFRCEIVRFVPDSRCRMRGRMIFGTGGKFAILN